MSSELTKLISSIDLPKLIADYYPNSGAVSSKVGRCIAMWRGGQNHSVSIFRAKDGTWMYKDWVTRTSGNAYHWLLESQGMSKSEAVNVLKGIGDFVPVMPEAQASSSSSKRTKSKKRKIVKTYDYLNLSGQLVHQTVRFEPKSFLQRRPTPQQDKWIWGLTEGTYFRTKNGDWSKHASGDSKYFGDCETILYRLPSLQEAMEVGEPVIVVEGEKDVDALQALGFIATCNCGGGGNWTEEELMTLAGHDIVLFADNDLPDEKTGIGKGLTIAEELCSKLEPIAKRLRGVVLMPSGFKDVSDYIELGSATFGDIAELIANAPLWEIKEELKVIGKQDKNVKQKPAKKNSIEQIQEVYQDLKPYIFKDKEDNSYVEVFIDDHWECYLVASKRFKQRLRHEYYRYFRKVLSSDTSLNAFIAHLDASAVFQKHYENVGLRVCGDMQTISVDLTDSEWRAVDITADGWQVVDKAKHKLVRSSGMQALPLPAPNGALDELRELLFVDDTTWALLAGFLVMCFHPSGPYPILHLVAEQGAGKSNTARMLKSIVDPHSTMLRSDCKDEHNLFIACATTRLPIFDNLSYLSQQMSDSFCRVATGGTFATRMLYEQDQEKSITIIRPVILTSINEVATRSDLLSRSILINLPRIPDGKRISEQVIQQRLDDMRPRLLTALFNAVSHGLKKLQSGSLEFDALTRMLDFEKWVMACEEGLGLEEGEFQAALYENRRLINEVALSATVLPKLVIKLISIKKDVEARATELLQMISELADESDLRAKDYPKTSSILGKQLKRIQPDLRTVGIHMEESRKGNDGQRYYRIYTKAENGDET